MVLLASDKHSSLLCLLMRYEKSFLLPPQEVTMQNYFPPSLAAKQNKLECLWMSNLKSCFLVWPGSKG